MGWKGAGVALAALLAALLAASGVAAQEGVSDKEPPNPRSRNCRPDSRNQNPQSAFAYPGPSGPVRMMPWRTRYECVSPTVAWERWGLWREQPEPVKYSHPIQSEPGYYRVIPYSSDAVFVRRFNGGGWTRYRLNGGGEERGRLPYEDIQLLHGGFGCQEREVSRYMNPALGMGAALAVGPLKPNGKRDYSIFFGSDEPAVLTDLGGPGVETPIRRKGDLILAQWRGDDGKLLTRLFDLKGAALSPVLLDVAVWLTPMDIKSGYGTSPCAGMVSVDLFVAGPSLDEKPEDAFVGPLLIPLDSRGQPAPLPPGAIGMFAATTAPYGSEVKMQGPYGPRTPRIPGVALPESRLWGVVYPTGEGWEYTLTHGTPQQALAESPAAKRYQAVGRGGDYFFTYAAAAKSWQGLDPTTGRFWGAPAADLQAAVQNTWAARSEANRQAWEAEMAERKAYDEAQRARARAEGRQCQYGVPWGRGMDAMVLHARECPHVFSYWDINRMIDEGAPADVTDALVRRHNAELRRQEAYRAEQAELARNYVPPGSWQTAMRLAGDAIVQQNQRNTQSWLDQRRAQYQADWQRSQRAY